MKFKKRMKKDKKFRYIIFVLILVGTSILISNTPDKKESRQSFETCFEYNELIYPTFWKWPASGETYSHVLYANKVTDCRLADCYVGKEEGLLLDGPNLCLPYVPVGWLAEKEYSTQACEYQGSISHNSNWNKCIFVEEEDRINDNEAEIAGLLDDLGLDTGDMSPKTKYYLVIFGGGFMALMLITSVI